MVQVRSVPYCTVLRCAVLYRDVMYSVVLCCAVLYRNVMYCAVLYCMMHRQCKYYLQDNTLQTLITLFPTLLYSTLFYSTPTTILSLHRSPELSIHYNNISSPLPYPSISLHLSSLPFPSIRFISLPFSFLSPSLSSLSFSSFPTPLECTERY
jgi:hypothetical protein